MNAQKKWEYFKPVLKTLAWLFTLYIALGVFIAVVSQTAFRQLQVEHLYWSYDHHLLVLIGVPLLLVLIKQRRAVTYGLYINRQAVFCIGVTLALTVLLPILVDLAQAKLLFKDKPAGYFFSALFFQLILSGCGEELFFRGLYQGELNRVCKRKWRIMGERFGPGLLIAAILFGFGHLGLIGWLAHGNELNPAAFFFTLGVGLALGFAREAVGCIIVIGFLHGGIDTYQDLISPSPLARAVHFAGVGFCFWLVLTDRFGIRNRSHKTGPTHQSQDRSW
ncbi:MAG: CPBP family intramembrane glutamic endopeptidase [Planctomycetota bacterium]